MTVNDHEAITRKVYEYAYGIDTRDWDLYRNIFAETVTTDFSSYHGNPSITMSADDWVNGVKPLFTGLDATQHTMSNPIVDIASDGDSARCRVYMQAAHILGDWPRPEFTIGGYYDDRLVRLSDEWRIMAVTLIVWWRRGDETLMTEAVHRGKRALQSDS